MGGNKDLLLLLFIIAADLIRNDLAVLRSKLEDFGHCHGQLAILALLAANFFSEYKV